MPDSPANPYIRTYAKDVAMLQAKEAQAASGPKPPVDEEREAVLARLRAKAVEQSHAPTLLPKSMPTPFPNVPTPQAPPVSFASPPPVPPNLPGSTIPVPSATPFTPAERPAPMPAAPTAPAVPSPSPLHTYTSDFADRIDTKGASAFSVLASEADRGVPAPQVVSSGRGPSKALLTTVFSILLVLLGGGGLYAAYIYVNAHRSVSLAPSVTSLIFADEREAVTGEGTQLMQAIVASAKKELPEGQVRVLYLTESSTTPDGKTVTVPLAGGRLVGALQLSAPDILLRNIAPESTVGIVHKGPETRAFFILKVMSYERTFAGMLQWENSMQAALGSLYPPYGTVFLPEPKVVTTSKIVNGKLIVSTSSTAVAAPDSPPRFVDEVAANHDVRALKDAAGRTILLYGYQDKSTLIIARDEAAFEEILNRLSATKQE